MEELKKSRYFIIIVFIILGIFYWFGLKPQNDKRECYVKATEARERWPEKDINLDRVFNVIYGDCLKSKGY